MKKGISCILVLCFMLGVFSSFVFSTDNTYGYTLGDVDDDNTITMTDLLALRKYLLGLYGQKDINPISADADESGDVAMNDLLKLRKMLLGLDGILENNGDEKYRVDTVTIDGRNINRYTIVVTEDNPCMMYSAKVLKRYVNAACGVSLNITTDEDSEMYKISYMFDVNNESDLGEEGYRLRLEDNGDLSIICGTMRGPIYATYFFLEEIVGWRFLISNFDDYSEASGFKREGNAEYLYRAENVNMPSGFDETEVPFFAYRTISHAGVTSDNICANRLNAVDGGGGWKYIMNAERGWCIGTVFIHAHSYMYQCGIEWNEQPCLTSETTYNQIMDYNIALVEQRKGVNQLLGESWTQISCSPNDNTNFCQCANCKTVYESEGSIAGTVFRLSNRVAENMDKIYPGIEIYTIAYWDARNPPKMTRPHENVCVHFCIGGCNNHTYNDTQQCADCGGNKRLVNKFQGGDEYSTNVTDLYYFEKWCELTNNIYVWYYSSCYTFPVAPSPNVFNVYEDIKYCAGVGTKGIYYEGSSTAVYSFEYLKGYLCSKMMWNPFMSEEEFNSHLNEFLFIYFGDGWQYIREYLEKSNYAGDILGCWTNNFDRPFNMYSEEYFADNYYSLRELFVKALEKTDDAEQKHRIQLCSLQCDFLGLSAVYERDYVNGDTDTKKRYTELYKAFYDAVVKYDIVITTISGDDYDSRGCANFPSSRDDVKSPMTWISYDFTGKWEWIGGRWQ